tara:strand:- start:768 stop:1997 length:1230 start_codon:yes stop_codon:yes gene_type:complete
MKIVHLTTHVSGGAGSLASNIFKVSIKKKDQTNILISTETVGFNLILLLYLSLIYRLHDLVYSILGSFKLVEKKYLFFALFPSFPFKKKFENETSNVDIFFIYWVSRFYDSFDLRKLKFKNPKAKFIFFNMDEAPLTGGCHYKFGCKNFENSCIECPAVNSHLIQNKISKEFKTKINTYSVLKPKFILPSSKYYTEFQNSVFLNKYSFIIKPYGAYFEQELNDFIKKRKTFLNRNYIKTNLLVRSSYEPRKGGQLFLDTIKKLSIGSTPLLDRFKLHVVGDNYLIENGISKMINTQFHGIVNRNRLFELYAECDVFIVTSEEDSGPIMINECSGLGVYILSTDVGVASDLITDENGKLYDRNSESLVESIKSLNHKNIRNFSRGHLKSEDLNNLTFEKFYEEIINEITQ